jgi:hypothetical protein
MVFKIKITNVIFSVIILIVVGSMITISYSNNKIINNNYKCIINYKVVNEEWCDCVKTSINMFSQNGRRYIPSFLFDNNKFLEREEDIYKEYCLGELSL